MIRVFPLVFFFALPSFLGSAEKENDLSKVAAALRKFIPDQMARLGVPGVSVALIKGGKCVWAEGFGLADKEKGKPVDTETLFPACSCSKPVTALAALRLSERGRLDLDSPIEDLLVSWKPPKRPFYAPVTVRLILAHRAGISMHGVPSYAKGDPKARNARQELASNVSFLQEPGIGFRYSGGGFIILQVILEDVTGKSFEEVMKEEIFEPLGMRSSTFLPYRPPFEERMAMGYYADMKPVGWRRTGGLAAAWLHTTPSDLSRFLIAVYNADRLNRTTVVTPRTAHMMLTPTGEATGRYGQYTSLGFFLIDTPAGRVVYHGGSNRGYKCGMWIFLKSGDGLVVMTNSNNGRKLCNSLYERLYPEAVLRPPGK